MLLPTYLVPTRQEKLKEKKILKGTICRKKSIQKANVDVI